MKSTLKKVDSPVEKSLILVCEKCGKKLENKPDENPARIIQKALKEKVKSEFGKNEIRPVVSSCMNVCPDGQIAIGILGVDSKNAQFFTVENPKSSDDFDQLWSDLKKQF